MSPIQSKNYNGEVVTGGVLRGVAVPRRPFTVKSLTERWDCSEAHIRNRIARRELPAKRLGKLVGPPRRSLPNSRMPTALGRRLTGGSAAAAERGANEAKVDAGKRRAHRDVPDHRRLRAGPISLCLRSR